MSPDMQITRHWRLNPERYRLEGIQCSCGYKSLSQKNICPNCGWETQEKPFGIGTVKLISNEKPNEERDVTLSIDTENKFEIKLSLNGLSHSLEIGMKLPVFIRRSITGETPIYSIKQLTSSSK